MNRRIPLLALALSLVPAAAAAQDAGTTFTIVQPPPDEGFRLHATVGYPALTAIGLGYKLGRTELMVQGGGAAVWAMVAGGAEASASYDIARWRWALLHGGLAASVLSARGFAIDCYGDESCDDWLQTLWFVGPRFGGRIRLDRNKVSGAIPWLDLTAGPVLVMCQRECPRGEYLVSAAVQLRGVLDFHRAR